MDLARMPGAGIGRDISKGEMAEKGLHAFIEGRHAKRVRDEGERAVEDAWRDSERREEARRRAENPLAWCEYHRDQAARHRAVLEGLIAHHEEQATKLLGGGGTT